MNDASILRPLTDELPTFVAIAANAYPAWHAHTEEDRQPMRASKCEPTG